MECLGCLALFLAIVGIILLGQAAVAALAKLRPDSWLIRSFRRPTRRPPDPWAKQRENDYLLAMGAAQKAMKEHNYAGAANAYKEALRLKFCDPAATAGHTEAQRLSVQQAEEVRKHDEARKTAEYNRLVQQARVEAGKRQWGDAIANYEAAGKVLSLDPVAVEELQEAQKSLAYWRGILRAPNESGTQNTLPPSLERLKAEATPQPLSPEEEYEETEEDRRNLAWDNLWYALCQDIPPEMRGSPSLEFGTFPPQDFDIDPMGGGHELVFHFAGCYPIRAAYTFDGEEWERATFGGFAPPLDDPAGEPLWLIDDGDETTAATLGGALALADMAEHARDPERKRWRRR